MSRICVGTVSRSQILGQAYDDWMLLAAAADARIQAKLPLRFVRFPRGFADARARFYANFRDRVAGERHAPRPHAVDLLAWTMREQPDMDDTTLAHILGQFYFGGVFSTTTTLVSALHQLHRHPDAAALLTQEAASVVDAGLTLERVREARWIEAVILEAMRVLPAVRLTIRAPVADTELAGVTLPAGTTIMISNQFLHRDPAHWSRADAFDPARWQGGGLARDPLGSGHFFPFGRGPRACVAGWFAVAFLQVALATLAARARLELDSSEPYQEGFFFGVVLPKGITGRVLHEPRPARAAAMPVA